MVMACVNLTECHHGRATCFALNIGILVCSLFGVLGAYRNDARLLGWFLMLIVFFIGFEVGFIIWSIRMLGTRGCATERVAVHPREMNESDADGAAQL